MKNKKTILTEQLDRFKKILNYDPSIGQSKITEGFSFVTSENDAFGDEEEDLIFGSGLSEADDEQVDDELAGIEDELGDMPPEDDMGGDEMPPEDDMGGDEMPPEDDMGGEDLDLQALSDEEETGEEETGEEEIELDVTELVQSSEEAKASADASNAKIEELMGMVSKLEQQLGSLGNISSQVEALEAELESRVPTPEEKIEMRSLSSYPYNIKLSDYWDDKKDQYIDMDAGNKTAPDKQYELTRDDINSTYNDAEIKNSFSVEDIEDEI